MHGGSSATTGDGLTTPMQGTVVKVAVAEGDTVAAGDLIVMIEAMKMEQPLNAHKAGTVTGLTAEQGVIVKAGATICRIVDEPGAA
jgi:acetyl-CoA/propionyl-CoA carboxylase biotin carboxyl carrier protein